MPCATGWREIIRQQRGDHAHALAQHWQGQPGRRMRADSWLPLAAATALSALVLAGTYTVLSLSLGAHSDPVYSQIQALRLPPPVVAMPQPAPRPRLAQFLQSDIKSGLVAVRDEIDRSVVTIRGDGLFAPGSATLMPEREALMQRIADALAPGAGQRAGDGPHRQPADPHRALSVQLASLAKSARARCASC